jgi:hypothetical protein
MQIGGAISVVVVGGLVFAMLQMEKRRKRAKLAMGAAGLNGSSIGERIAAERV